MRSIALRKRAANFLRTIPPAYRVALFLYRILGRLVFLFEATSLSLKQFWSGQRQLITASEATFFGDHFATIHHVAFLRDKRFIEAFNSAFDLVDPKDAERIRDLNISWRAHIVTWAANQAMKLDGDFVECGVWWGFLSKTICEYTDFATSDKKFFLLDTWGDPLSQELNHKKYQKDVYEIVKDRFKSYPNVHLVRGFVPEVFEQVRIQEIAYLAIDMNGHIAERKTLDRYYDLVVPGGIIYFDDYGWGYPQLRETVDDFFKDKPETLLHFPSGNSIVVKL